MQSSASGKVLIGGFIALALSSVGLKAMSGPPRNGIIDPHPGQLERQLVSRLQRQGFSTSARVLHIQSTMIYGTRGACRLSVRDARNGDGEKTAFALQASDIGPVRYLYRGNVDAAPPVLAMRVGRFETELLNRLGFDARLHVPVALATSAGCGEGAFGLDDMQIAA